MMGAFLGGVANGQWIPWVRAEVVRPPRRELSNNRAYSRSSLKAE
jgi:hypothetical protein